MSQKTIPFVKLSPLADEVKNVVNEVMEKGVFFNGHFSKLFEEGFKQYFDVKCFVPTANCTDSLEIILRANEIGIGDEVITSAFSWYSDASVIQLVGASPVFADIDLSHYGANLDTIKRLIGKQTKALILPHLFGITHPDIIEIKLLCDEAEILLIEDCAQAHGSSLGGKPAGTFGTVAAFSFYPTKNLGALGDGGCIVTNDEEMAIKYKKWANHGQYQRNQHVQLGRNSRLDELQAAVLATKLPKLDLENKKRRGLAQIYHQELAELPFRLPSDYEGHVYHQFVISFERRDELRKYLLNKGIETDVHYPYALTQMEVFRTYAASCANAEKAAATVLSLPIHPAHNEEDIQYVCRHIKMFFKE